MDQIARTPQQLGAVIRRKRKQLSLSQDELGTRIHLRQATISKLEAGEPATRLQTLIDALAALDLEIVIRPRTRGSTAQIEDLF
ncbi:MAG: helix-turn-helix domain-containing protein [Betaproteobacteria bacterium]|nr:helix-turn-helix domain-containing protein [Betaproteobacteria bacterium]